LSVDPSKGGFTDVSRGQDAIIEDPDTDMMAGIRNDIVPIPNSDHLPYL
jgi:hypothetical protein